MRAIYYTAEEGHMMDWIVGSCEVASTSIGWHAETDHGRSLLRHPACLAVRIYCCGLHERYVLNGMGRLAGYHDNEDHPNIWSPSP